MERIRALVLDKNILVRQAFATLLNKEPNVAVRVSGNVTESEKVVSQENPHVLFLNIEDTDTDGFSIFNELRAQYPGLPIVVISTLSEKGAKAALYALRRGAVNVITRPKKNTALLFANRHFEKRVPSILRGVERVIKRGVMNSDNGNDSWHHIANNKEKYTNRDSERLSKGPARVIVMGGCMGGPAAMSSILRTLPADFPVPIVTVQHFPKYYTSALAQELSKISPLAVKEVTDGTELKAGTIWVAPGGWHSEIKQIGIRFFVKLHRGPRVNEVRPSIDVLFRSAARIYGPSVLGVVLSGNGTDGLAGVQEIRDRGGYIITQDPKNAMVDELPMSVRRKGLANSYYSADKIGRQLLKFAGQAEKSMKIQKYYNFNLFKTDNEYFNTI